MQKQCAIHFPELLPWSPGATPNTNISGTQWTSSYRHQVFSKSTPWAHCCSHWFLMTPSSRYLKTHFATLCSQTSGIWMMESCRDQGQHYQGQWTIYRETATEMAYSYSAKYMNLASRVSQCSILRSSISQHQILRFLVSIAALISALPSLTRSGRKPTIYHPFCLSYVTPVCDCSSQGMCFILQAGTSSLFHPIWKV